MTQHTLESQYKAGWLAAVPCGKAKRVPVRVQSNGASQSELLANYGREPYRWLIVIAQSATAAANWVRDNFDHPPNTEILAIGPKGGEVSRFIGWESYISREVFTKPGGVQHALF